MRPPIREAIANALRFRCPNCHVGPIFANWLNKILPRCPHCGLPYHRESGYYLGGMIITYILTAVVLVPLYVVVTLFLPGNFPGGGFFSGNATVFWVVLAVVLTFVFVRPSYSLWLSLDFWVDPWSPGEPRS